MITRRQRDVLSFAAQGGVKRIWWGQGQADWTWRTSDQKPASQAVDRLAKLQLIEIVDRDDARITPRGREVLQQTL